MTPVPDPHPPAGAPPGAERTLASYALFVRRHRRLLVAAALVGVVLGLLVQLSKPERFTSSADVVLVSTTTRGGGSGEYRDTTIDSALQQLRSQEVLGRAAARMDYPGGSAGLGRDLIARPVPNSRIVRLSVSALAPATAVEAVTNVVDSLLEVRRSAIEAETQRRKQSVGGQLAAVNRELDRLNLVVVQGEDPAGSNDRTVGGRFLIEQRGYLRGEQAALATLRPDPGYVAQPPTVPTDGARTGLAVTMASTLTVAVVAAVTLAAARSWLRGPAERPGSTGPDAVGPADVGPAAVGLQGPGNPDQGSTDPRTHDPGTPHPGTPDPGGPR
ncbi:hypothetical protein MF406_04815 [Georgenia sp. TF02-10]|uniref:hypothetical protein n=1 Tax=Georgenia sp. TF02-10 TaxID=2917725 RepID=UPI001FA7C186|nr:hypothetical protein [Georgenia sp. TF02-10]UNX55586.1 hypothetical protein MF406_04815 [Georgenia sp. TF02-10]